MNLNLWSKMISWFKYPFVRLLLPLMMGIWSAFFFKELMSSERSLLVLLIIIGFLFCLLLLTAFLVRNYRLRWIFSVTLNVFLVILGFSFVRIDDNRLKNNDISNLECVPKCYIARLCECPTVREKSVKVMMELQVVKDTSGVLYDMNPKVMAYFENDDRALSLEYGDYIAFFTNPDMVEKPPNPEQFDYRDYLYKKGVTSQVYLKSSHWLDLDCSKPNPIYEFSYWIRDFLLQTMQDLGVEDNEYAVAAAILLGYDDSLPYDLRHKYVAAGAMHILCVSGLHVGVIFMVFSYMLAFLDDRKNVQRFLKHIVLLLLIWFYALLAGLSPSILRATIMLSFVIVGDIINRKGVLLNSLAASAFILLCINPSNLFDIGFQLSYIAVVGIMFLQKPVSRMLYSKYKIVNKIWEITSVTIAAQIATAPFTIYYFHQFPLYFWLSNLFMTPISSVVIIGGMIMLLVFFIPYINVIVAGIVSKMIFIMNLGVSWIESLPYSIIKGLYVTDIQFVVLLIILLSILFLAELKEKRFLFLIMTSVIVFLLLNITTLIKQNEQKELLIYSVNNMTAIDFISGREHVLLCDSSFINDESAFSYNIENYLIKKGLFHCDKKKSLDEDFDEIFVKKSNNIVTFEGKLIGLSDGSVSSYNELSYKIPLDYMLVYGRKRQKLSNLLNVYSFDYLIIDGSVPYYLADDFIRDAIDLGIKCYSIRDSGSFVIR